MIKEIKSELKELQNIGINIPEICFDSTVIRNFFKDIDFINMGSRDKSNIIDSFIIINQKLISKL